MGNVISFSSDIRSKNNSNKNNNQNDSKEEKYIQQLRQIAESVSILAQEIDEPVKAIASDLMYLIVGADLLAAKNERED